MDHYRAYRIHRTPRGIEARLEDLSSRAPVPGEVVIEASYSSINYKDALAVTGAGKIMRHFPLVAGIDVSGVVTASAHPDFREGDDVLVTGCGLGEHRDGGFAQRVFVPGDSVVRIPDGLDMRSAMGLGTAGFTAALAVERMERNGQSPGCGPVAVTGATGGVGSIAIDILAGRGYEVVALSRKEDARAYLLDLGATAVLGMAGLAMGRKPLESAQWGGAVDNVGGEVLGWLTRCVSPGANIACVGLAGGTELNTTVMPLILRGVSLLGINCDLCSRQHRQRLWKRLATDLRPRHLDRIVSRQVALEDLPTVVAGYLDGTVVGRSLVVIR